ncbi:MAG TPA: 2'-5' RNA ligase family protein, partial [Desertimonas sp.]|nr:2'-5' RNA ligase family protein [Desertimonas sp.]
RALYDLRARHLRNLGRKMPSHVTVLFPFRSPVDCDAVDEIERVCGEAAPFDATFSEVRRFGSSLVWLQPEPTAAFAELTAVILAAFPDCAPYAGKHRQQTPHLSVGSRLTREVADVLADEVVSLLPLVDRIDALSLMYETGDGWRHDRSWPLLGSSRRESTRPFPA